MPIKSRWTTLRQSLSKKSPNHVRFATLEPSFSPNAVFEHLPPLHARDNHDTHHSSHHHTRKLESVRIHPILAHGELHWDVSSHPAYASYSGHHLSSSVLAEPATIPPQHSITVVSSYLPWTIFVRPKRGSYVTVEDVIYSIFSDLRRGVSGEEFMGYLSPQAQARASEAYRRRYRRLHNDNDYQREKLKGARRVDFLLEHNRWKGLISTTNGPSVWELKVS